MTECEIKHLALVAAVQSSAAAAELVRFADEGPQLRFPFGEVEVVELLADALKMAIEVETAAMGDDLGHPEEAEQRNQLLGALTKFLEGWA